MYKKSVLAAAALLSLLMLTGCAGGPPQYSAESLPTELVAEAEPYLVGPGDALGVFVWDHPDLTTTVVVRPDGKITMPLVEDLQAAGKSPSDLGQDIETVLGEYVRSPVVTVSVQSFVGVTEQQVRVVGQAVAPQALQYRQGMTVLDVMIAVGGLSEFASGNRATIVRELNGEPAEIRVRLDDLLNEGSIDQNVRMMPGDVLIIPESFF